MCSSLTFLFHIDSTFFFLSFMSFLVGFTKKVMHVCGDVMGPRLWESSQRPVARHHVWPSISFGGINNFSMEECTPFSFLRSWALMVPYLCSRFHILNRFILEECVSRVEGGPPYFSHAYVQRKMSFFLQLERCTLFLRVNNYQCPKFISIFDGLPPWHIP